MKINPSLIPIVISPSVRQQLIPHGLSLNGGVQIERNLMFNAPACSFENTWLTRLKIDAYSYIGPNTRCATTTIGRYCSIGYNSDLGIPCHHLGVTTSSAVHANGIFSRYTGEIKRLNPYQLENREDNCEVTIGHDVWIGAHVYVNHKVTIGTGAVIGTGSIITHDVPPYAIVAGVGGGENSKGIIKRYRFSDEVISDLLELKWWEYDLPKMLTSGMQVPLNEGHEFVQFMRDQDPATLPRIATNWKYLNVQDSNNVNLIPVPEDFDMGHRYPRREDMDDSWL